METKNLNIANINDLTKELNRLKKGFVLYRISDLLKVTGVILSILAYALNVAFIISFCLKDYICGFLVGLTMLCVHLFIVLGGIGIAVYSNKKILGREFYYEFMALQLFICVVSIGTNYIFLSSVIINYTIPLIGVVLSWILAIIPDLFSVLSFYLSCKVREYAMKTMQNN